MSPDPRRAIPSVGALLETSELQPLLERAPRTLVVDAVREVLDDARRAAGAPALDAATWAAAVQRALDRRLTPSLRPLLNATGVVLHTNLGRAPLARAALDAIANVAAGYTNLEYDLDAGARGSRYVHCAELLCELAGAEHAMVVNNCAAALVLALNTLADGREAIVSRGELVEIGGSFRVPDIMTRSGARLVEVGTTNRTSVEDYAAALNERTGALVKIHRSNFAISGFVAEASLEELVALGEQRGVPVVQDFGSGLMLSLAAYGLTGERTAPELVRANPALVLMSGDKLLGGPQAGIILGRRATVDLLARNPLARALRVDKLTLAALEATLALYREPYRALREVPALAMLVASADDVKSRAERVAQELARVGLPATVISSEASVGGGAFPTAKLASWAVSPSGDAMRIEQRLRSGDVPVIARVMDGQVLLDLRSVPDRDDDLLISAVRAALAEARS